MDEFRNSIQDEVNRDGAIEAKARREKQREKHICDIIDLAKQLLVHQPESGN